MTKGLPRSLSRGKASPEAITKIRIPIDHSISVVAVSTAIGFGSVILAGFPEGQLKVMASAIKVQFAGPTDANLVDTWEGDFGVGSTPASDATISGTDVDLIGSTAIPAATAELSPEVNAIIGVDHILDNTENDLEVNLNLLIDAADITDDETVVIAVTGYMEITLLTMLDD